MCPAFYPQHCLLRATSIAAIVQMGESGGTVSSVQKRKLLRFGGELVQAVGVHTAILPGLAHDLLAPEMAH